MTCQTCGHPHQENFCPNCGEKHHDPHHLTFRHFAEETLEGFTHVDHRFFRSVRALLFKPGFLTAEFVRGRRVPYMLPLPLFLVCNLLFFFFQTNNAFNQPIDSFTQYKPYTYFNTKQTAERVLDASGKSDREFAGQFNATMTTASKAYLFVLVPVFALLLALFFVSKKRTFIEHLLFATHFYSFVLLFFLLQLALIIPLSLLIGQSDYSRQFDMVISLISLGGIGVYLSLAFRRFYQINRPWSAVAAFAGSVAFIALVVGYRMLLFYKIMYSGH